MGYQGAEFITRVRCRLPDYGVGCGLSGCSVDYQGIVQVVTMQW